VLLSDFPSHGPGLSMTDANTSSTPVFRTVEVAQNVTITLGQPLSPEAMALMKQVGPQRFQLNPGTYAGAKEIDVQLGVGAAVHQMDFTYGADAHCNEMVANYVAELGPPTSQHGEITMWRDSATLFELLCLPAGIRSFLRDLAPTAS
jgi:formylmethanofuran dehydrogenase subunit A